LPEPASREPAIGEVLALLTGAVLGSDGLDSGGSATDGAPRAGDRHTSVNRQALEQTPQPADP
jgi:hypothetical protein